MFYALRSTSLKRSQAIIEFVYIYIYIYPNACTMCMFQTEEPTQRFGRKRPSAFLMMTSHNRSLSLLPFESDLMSLKKISRSKSYIFTRTCKKTYRWNFSSRRDHGPERDENGSSDEAAAHYTSKRTTYDTKSTEEP